MHLGELHRVSLALALGNETTTTTTTTNMEISSQKNSLNLVTLVHFFFTKILGMTHIGFVFLSSSGENSPPQKKKEKENWLRTQPNL
jgi:hypothetical protein